MRLLVAKIVNTHGLAGEVKALLYADDITFLDGVSTLETTDGRQFTLSGFRGKGGSVLLSFGEINGIDEALSLKGQELFAKRTSLPPLPEGRYYIADLLGLSIRTSGGRILGTLTDCLKTGANDCFVVKNEGGGEYLLPVIDDVVKSYDLDGGFITVDLIKGLAGDENEENEGNEN